MINVNELRIGNIFKQGKIKALPLDFLNDGEFHDIDFENSCCDLDELQSIELTPEVLFKLGFEKIMYETLDTKKHCFKKDFLVLAPFCKCYDAYSTINSFNGTNTLSTITTNGAPLKYLHQLQNLYYAITEKELPGLNNILAPALF